MGPIGSLPSDFRGSHVGALRAVPKDEILPEMSGILLCFIISVYLVFICIPGTESLKPLEFYK